MMNQEEMRIATRKVCEDFEPTDDIEEFVRGVALSALDALEEANRKLDRVKALWEKCDEERTLLPVTWTRKRAETLNRCVQQIGEILLGESTT